MTGLSWNTIGSFIGAPIGLLCLLYAVIGYRKRDLKNKVVFITGASSGLGEACAKVFYKAGCNLILGGRDSQQLERVKTFLQGDNSKIQIITIDLSDLSSIPQKAEAAVKLFGSVDILINNAGISYNGMVEDTTVDVFIQLMTVNFFGQVALTKAVLKHMLDRREGCIVGISSVQGKIAIPYRSAYTASKHAFQAFHDSLRAEVSDRGVDVVLVSPSYIRTNLSKNTITSDGTKLGVMTKEIAKGMSADYCASCVLSAVTLRQKDVVPAPLHHRLAILIRNLSPTLYFKIMEHRAKDGKKEYIKDK